MRHVRVRKIKVGQTYGNVTVLSELPYIPGKTAKKFNIQCNLCGKIYAMRADYILEEDNGCIDCLKQKHLRQKDQKRIIAAQKYIGKTFGELTLTELTSIKYSKTERARQVYGIFQCSCGNVVERPIYRIINGRTKTCGHAVQDMLDKGQEKGKETFVEGTKITAIDGSRGLNKNNTSGVTGVSKMKDGRYEAYLTFKRTRYNLGRYATKEEAIDARKKGEERFYGAFLEDHNIESKK